MSARSRGVTSWLSPPDLLLVLVALEVGDGHRVVEGAAACLLHELDERLDLDRPGVRVGGRGGAGPAGWVTDGAAATLTGSSRTIRQPNVAPRTASSRSTTPVADEAVASGHLAALGRARLRVGGRPPRVGNGRTTGGIGERRCGHGRRPRIGGGSRACCYGDRALTARAPIVQWPRTPPFQGGNTGSNPVGGATPGSPHGGQGNSGPVVQFGVHAGLSSRRSRVQIPSGPPSPPIGQSRTA